MNTSPEPERLDLTACARLLGVRRYSLKRIAKRGLFAAPAGTEQGRPYWHETTVLTWAAEKVPQLADRIPLRYWPNATEPAPYLGAVRLTNAVAVGWRAAPGPLWTIWTAPGHPGWRHRDQALAELPDAAAFAVVSGQFGIDGPSLDTYTPADLEAKSRGLRWSKLSQIIGQPMPYWPYMLRIPELLEAWRPGALAVLAAAIPDLDTTPLLRLAACLDDDSPAQRVLVHQARLFQLSSTRYAEQDLKILAEILDADYNTTPDTTVVAATPMPVPAVDRDDLDEGLRRAGWLDILARTDTLAVQCVEEVMKWDGGDPFPHSQLEAIDPGDGPHAAEWAQRLLPHPGPHTAAIRILDPDDSAVETLIDPATDAPVVRTKDGKLHAAVPQRLPATSPLTEVVLDEPIWVRVADGTLYLAPLHSYYGLSWGYGGSGPGSLALLIDRLLADVNCIPADGVNGAAPGLEKLTETDWPKGTILTRPQMEAARDGRPYPAGDDAS
ncbi:hypothetical protein [Spirillospora sp. CA-128828]|uniref:hypothetical protein n=1 Tax=Spirillospora sp. CA-128828 TaxID=3240033 RepID=UPI003D8FD560